MNFQTNPTESDTLVQKTLEEYFRRMGFKEHLTGWIGLLNCLNRRNLFMNQCNNQNNHFTYVALALAKECYVMKLELLTNDTVVDDAIKFVASCAILTTEKANSHERVTVDKENSDSNDVQGSEENRSYEQQSTPATNNSIF
jgi:hypothetical protein